MKQINKIKKFNKNLVNLMLVLSALLVFNCSSSDDDEAECTATPVSDGRINEFNGDCRVSAEEEHIRLTGVTVPTGGTITLWAKAADTTGNNGIRLAIDGTNITYTNLDDTPATNTFMEPHMGLTNTTLCFDLHYEEDPIHALSWKGSNCDGEGDEDEALFNSEDGGMPTGDDVESQNRYLYQISGGATMAEVSVSRIETREPIFEE